VGKIDTDIQFMVERQLGDHDFDCTWAPDVSLLMPIA